MYHRRLRLKLERLTALVPTSYCITDNWLVAGGMSDIMSLNAIKWNRIHKFADLVASCLHGVAT